MSQLITKEYQGNVFHFREDGYFNMTKAAAHFGKRVDHFLANAETKDYLGALNGVLVPEIPVTKVQYGNGRSPSVGTWGHPKLAVFFARWLDAKFAVFCDMAIDDILNKKAELATTEPTMSSREIAELVESRHEDVKRSMQRLADRGLITFTPMAEKSTGAAPPFSST